MKKMFNILCIIPIISLSYAIVYDVSITGGSPGYDPSTLIIESGDIVIWTNNTSTHTVTGDNGNWGSGTLTDGDTFQHQFDDAGEFPYGCNFHGFMSGNISVTALDIEYSSPQIISFNLSPVYPNPFNPTINIKYSLLENAFVELIIYDIQGRQIQSLIDDFRTVGAYSINWDASLYPSGLYFVKMTAGKYVSTEKLMLIK